MKGTITTICTLFLLLSACSAADSPPDGIPLLEKVKNEQGVISLKHWKKFTSFPNKNYSVRMVPEDKAFSDALVWSVYIDEKDMIKAVKKAAAAEGMKNIRTLKAAPIETSRMLEKNGKALSVIFEGTLKGKPAKLIAFVSYGTRTLPKGSKPKSDVTAFMAPDPLYVGFGGYAPLIVYWFNSKIVPDFPGDTDMSGMGRRSPEDQVIRLANFADEFNAAQIMMNYMAIQTMSNTMSIMNGLQQGHFNELLCQDLAGCRTGIGSDGNAVMIFDE